MGAKVGVATQYVGNQDVDWAEDDGDRGGGTLQKVLRSQIKRRMGDCPRGLPSKSPVGSGDFAEVAETFAALLLQLKRFPGQILQNPDTKRSL